MVTSIYSIGKVTGGAEIWALGFFVCIFIFVAVCLLFEANRTRKGFVVVLLGLLAAEIVCDVAWFLIYFPDGSYHNYGLQGIYGLLLWPALLILVAFISTRLNIARNKVR